MEKYYLVWCGYKETYIHSYRKLETLTKVLDSLIETYGDKLKYQVIYGIDIKGNYIINGNYTIG